MDNKIRIVTRPDFDGVVCAMLLREVFGQKVPVAWTEPNLISNNEFNIRSNDILANLPYKKPAMMWFDHHISNTMPDEKEIKGAFSIAPSAARVIYEYYKDSFDNKFNELIVYADKIDSASFNKEELFNPEKYPYMAVSATIGREAEPAYLEEVIHLLSKDNPNILLKNERIRESFEFTKKIDIEYEKILKEYTKVQGKVSISDFREMHKDYRSGNRFLVYYIFPETIVNLRVRYDKFKKDRTIISVGHSITNRKSKVNTGLLMKKYGGGGHFGAGSCNVHNKKAEETIEYMVNIFNKNIEREV